MYIFNDDSLSPVYNLRGCEFSDLDTVNYIGVYNKDEHISQDEFLFLIRMVQTYLILKEYLNSQIRVSIVKTEQKEYIL